MSNVRFRDADSSNPVCLSKVPKLEERNAMEKRSLTQLIFRPPLYRGSADILIRSSPYYWATMEISSHKHLLRGASNLNNESKRAGRGGIEQRRLTKQ